MTSVPRNQPPASSTTGLVPHGARWDSGFALQVISRGAGVAVPVMSPSPGPPKRVLSGAAEAKSEGGQLLITPTSAAAGETINVVVEF